MSNIQRSMNSMARPVPPRPPITAAPVAGITPKEITSILRRHIWLIILLTFLGLIIGGTSWFALRRYAPKYTAQAAIKVLPPGDVNPLIIGRQTTSKDISYQHRLTKTMLMKQQNMFQLLLKQDKVRDTKWFARFGDIEADRVKDAVKDLKGNLNVIPQRDSDLILVSMTCGNRSESRLIVNEMVIRFLKLQSEEDQGDTGTKMAERKKQLDKIQQELDLLNSKLEGARRGTKFANLNKATFRDYIDEKLENIERNRNNYEALQSQLTADVAILARRAGSEYDDVVRERIERDPIASSMRQRIAIFETNLASQLARFGEGHRRVREVRDTIEQAKTDLGFRQKEIGNIEVQSELIRAQEELIALQAQLETYEKQLTQGKQEYKELSDLRADYEDAMIDRDDKQAELEEMKKSHQILSAMYEDSDASKVKIAWRAPEPLDVSFPRLLVFVPGGFILGLMAGIGLAFAIELLNDLLRTPSDVMKHLRVPLLGMISHSDEDDGLDGIDIYHVVRQSPYSIMSECYRQLRTNLRLSASGVSHKTLLVTSCSSGCGKTSVATNLTSTLVAEGKRVLLIDTNFRRPSIAGIFPGSEANGSSGEGADSGLSNYLLGQCDFDSVVRAGGLEDLDIIDAGPLPANPAELLSNAKMSELLSKAEQSYDHVIIDGPPLIVSDAKVLASQVDATLVVFNTMSTRRGEAQRALRELRAINAEIAGTVLLGVKTMKGGYFQEIYKSYLQYQQVQLNAPV